MKDDEPDSLGHRIEAGCVLTLVIVAMGIHLLADLF